LLYTLVKIHRVPWVGTSFLLLILLLTALSTLPDFLGFIMPDIFTSYMFIILYLIGFRFFNFRGRFLSRVALRANNDETQTRREFRP
jgi:hypothetical protein